MVILRDYDLIHEAFSKTEFSGREQTFVIQNRSYFLGNGTSNGLRSTGGCVVALRASQSHDTSHLMHLMQDMESQDSGKTFQCMPIYMYVCTYVDYNTERIGTIDVSRQSPSPPEHYPLSGALADVSADSPLMAALSLSLLSRCPSHPGGQEESPPSRRSNRLMDIAMRYRM